MKILYFHTNIVQGRFYKEDVITQRGNRDGKKHIRGVLAYILADVLCCRLSWSGQRKTIKVENMPFIKYLRGKHEIFNCNNVSIYKSICVHNLKTDGFLIFLSPMATSKSQFSLDDSKQVIMSQLQHANDRVKINTEKHTDQ